MHPALDQIRQAAVGTPFEGRLWLVGGAVRDELLGRPEPDDYDIVTELSSGDLAALLHEKGVSTLSPVTYARFGTALVRVQGVNVELATARRESYTPDSRKPDVEPATLLEDARRRDFTVNTLMRNLHSGELADLLGTGLRDLHAKVLRTPLDPAATFRDDPLRMLRAVRFVWTLGFKPAEGLYEAIQSGCGRLSIVSGERIRDECVKMLRLADADRALEDLRRSGLLEIFAPELTAMKGVTQGSYHHLDVWDHTLLVVRNAGPEDLTLTLSALLHDVGKPATRSEDSGDIRFYQHERVGAEMARDLLNRLRFAGDEVEPVVKLVRNHMRLQTTPELSPSAARRLVRDLGPDLDRLLALVDADARGLKPGVKAMDVEAIRRRIEEVRNATPAETLQSPLSGREIMDLLGMEEGPEIGQAKSALLEEVLEGRLAPGERVGATRFLLNRASPSSGVLEAVLEGIARHPPRGARYCIGLSGFCGAGKSVLAHILAKRLPGAAVVETDVFWNPARDIRGSDWPAVEHKKLLEEVLVPAREGQPIRYRPYDWETGEPGQLVELGQVDFVIVEGIGLFRPSLNEAFDLRVWVDAPMEQAHAEGMRRDREEYGDPHAREWRDVWTLNDRDFFDAFRPRETADVVVPWFKGLG